MVNLHVEVGIYNVLKSRLAEAYNLEDDDTALLDTLEGQSPIQDIITKMVRDAKRAEAYAEAMKAIIADNTACKKRHETRAEKLRELAAWAMQECGLKTIQEADLTISQREGKPPLVITREPTTFDNYTTRKVVYSWDRDALRSAVEARDQEALSIAHLSNSSLILTVRTK